MGHHQQSFTGLNKAEEAWLGKQDELNKRLLRNDTIISYAVAVIALASFLSVISNCQVQIESKQIESVDPAR